MTSLLIVLAAIAMASIIGYMFSPPPSKLLLECQRQDQHYICQEER